MLGHIFSLLILLVRLGAAFRVKLIKGSHDQNNEQQKLSDSSPYTCEEVCADEIENFNLTERGSFHPLWDKFDISHVGGWNAANRQHCEVALMWHTSCGKNTCLANCDRQHLSEEVWERTCADRWQGDYNKFVIATKIKFKKSNELHFPSEHLELWMNKMSQTAPPCEVCSVHRDDEDSIPDACRKKNNVHKEVRKLLHPNMTIGDVQLSHDNISGVEASDATDQTSTIGGPFSAMLPVLVNEDCTRQCSHPAQELDKVIYTPVTTHPDGHNIYDSFGLTWLKSWHFLNKMHCHVALANLKWCERDACYWRCMAKTLDHTNKTPAKYCEAVWGSDYDNSFQIISKKAIKILSHLNIPMDNARRWWDDIVGTFDTCDPCADDFHTKSVPQPCWYEHNIYTEVWFRNLPEDDKSPVDAKTHDLFGSIFRSSIFCSILVFVVLAMGWYCMIRRCKIRL